MFKRMLVVAAVFAALAVPAGGLASNDTQYYPLTLTAQQELHVHGKTAAFLILVSNSSTTMKLSPLVPLDQNAKVARSSAPLVVRNQRLTWRVGVLLPGETKTLTLVYHRTVKFPPYEGSDGQMHTPPPATIGKNYEPTFTLYDTHYKLYTFVGVAVRPGMMK